jgi:hypothetical protein
MRALSIVLGALVIAMPSGAYAQSPSPTGIVDGAVYDSLRSQPLAGALVQLIETPPGRNTYGTTADSLGRFRIDSVRAGRYVAGMFHPILDTLGVSAPLHEITVAEGAATHLVLAIPSAPHLIRAICGVAADTTGLLVGQVHDGVTGAPLASSLVAVVWPVLILDARGARRETRQLHGKTNDDGWFAMCGLGAGDYQARAEMGPRATGFIDITVRPHDVARR